MGNISSILFHRSVKNIRMKIKLAKIRNEKNISIRQLSIKTEIPKSTLSDIENEKVSFKLLHQLEKIAIALDCKIGDIVESDYW